jgi:hypothetical protein
MSRQSIERVNSAIESPERKSTVAKLISPKLDHLRKDLAELSEPGDGLVTVRRSRLEGVDDFEVLKFSHLERFGDPTNPVANAVHQTIARRLN